MDMTDQLLAVRVDYEKKRYFDNYSEQLFCQVIKILIFGLIKSLFSTFLF